MSIRLMKKGDLERIAQLEKELFQSPWSIADFQYELDNNPFAKYYVLEKERTLIGYIGLWLLDNQCQITTIGVDQMFQGNGYASQLMDFVFSQCKQSHCQNINLEVRVSNDKAIALYEKYGFKNVAVRKNYYADHEDAYLMIKELEG